jgi:hypothetical protein
MRYGVYFSLCLKKRETLSLCASVKVEDGNSALPEKDVQGRAELIINTVRFGGASEGVAVPKWPRGL